MRAASMVPAAGDAETLGASVVVDVVDSMSVPGTSVEAFASAGAIAFCAGATAGAADTVADGATSTRAGAITGVGAGVGAGASDGSEPWAKSGPLAAARKSRIRYRFIVVAFQ
jgi:hypothetical protein